MNIDVFVSYHTESSLKIIESIVNKLEANSIKCWYAPRDTEDDYAGSISKAINDCKVFLLILNKDASESPHVLNELNKVTKRLSKKEEIHVIPFHVADNEISEAADYYIGRMHWIDAMTPPLERRIEELYYKIQQIVGVRHMDRINTEIKNSDKYYLLNSNVYASNNFLGREHELEKINKALTSIKNKVFLVGMGGIGKSETAKMYCQIYKRDYDTILWVPFMNSVEETVIDDNLLPICGLSRQDFLNESNHEYFTRKVNLLKKITNKSTLIIFDNFDIDKDENLDVLCSGNYSVLFTSRNHHNSDNLPEITIEPMSDKEQFDLFISIYKRNISCDDEKIIKKILYLLDAHPLSISLVASTMNASRIKPELMLNELTAKNRDNNAVNAVFARLKNVMGLADLNEQEAYLMQNLSLIPIQGIEVERLYQWCELQDYSVIDNLIRRSWIIHNPITDEVHLHPIVADLFLNELRINQDACNNLLKNFNEECGNVIGRNFKYRQMLFNYANYICSILPKNHKAYEDVITAKAKMLFNMAFYQDAISLFQEILLAVNKYENKIVIYRSLSHLFCLIHSFEQGLFYAEKGLKLLENKSLNDMNYNEIYSYKGFVTRIAEANRGLGNYDIAMEYAAKAYNICEQYLSYEDTFNSMTWAKYHLARIMFMRNHQDDIKKSEILFKEAIQLCMKRNDIWAVNFSKEYLGQIFMIRTQYKEALEITIEAYNSHLEQLGLYHADTAINIVLQGNVYRAMGDEKQACECYQRAIDIFEKCNCPAMKIRAKEIMDSREIGYLS